MRFAILLGAMLGCLLAGCGDLQPAKRRDVSPSVGGITMENAMNQGTSSGDTNVPTTDPNANPPAENPPPDATATTEPPPAEATPANPDPNTETVKAEAGVGKKGQYDAGLITTPLKAYFRADQRIKFDQIDYSLKLYKAEHDRFPKDFDEFKSAILQPSQIVLPELPYGHRYVYDAKKGELQVERPGK